MKDEVTVEVLIVDDRPENLLALENLLVEPGRTVIKASSGDEALARMLAHDFALVLLDVQMPQMDGFEVAELMRGSERTRHVPIIFVTAVVTDQQYVFRGYEAGAVDYLAKPIDPVILNSKVEVFCELYRQRKTIANQVEEIDDQRQELERRLSEIKVLQGLLPICCNCKKIRNDNGFWEAVEVYIRDHSEAEFTHSFCPECLSEYFPEQFTGR